MQLPSSNKATEYMFVQLIKLNEHMTITIYKHCTHSWQWLGPGADHSCSNITLHGNADGLDEDCCLAHAVLLITSAFFDIWATCFHQDILQLDDNSLCVIQPLVCFLVKLPGACLYKNYAACTSSISMLSLFQQKSCLEMAYAK